MNEWLQILSVSLATGFGSAIGNYLANRGLIKHIELMVNNKRGDSNGENIQKR